MPGFVDVSNMTSEEVRRMGHADDYDEETNRRSYRNPYAYRKPTKTYMPVSLDYKADDVWAASWQAYVTNGKQYIKAIMPDVPNHKTNRMIVEELLADTTQITQESRDVSEAMRRYFMGLTFKMIEGKQLSEFMKGAYDAACKSEIKTKLELAIIASLPATYEKSAKRDDVDRRINFARGGYIGDGALSQKVTLNIEVLKSVWSQKWNTWYITGITGEDQVVFFASKESFDIGTFLTITGNVKAHRDNSTQLSRVKVL
jgi:hypothetical protein